MNHTFKFTALAFILPIAFFMHSTAHARAAVYTYQELNDYLNQSSQGLVSGDDKAMNFLEADAPIYRVNKKRGSFEAQDLDARDAYLKLFHFDLPTYLKNSGAKDFLTAKVNYYKNLEFNEKKQRYIQESLHPEEWKSLFFPPQETLDLPPQAYDDRFLDPASFANTSSYFSADWHKAVDAKTNTRLTFHNDLQILTNNKSFAKKLELVKKSKKSIYIGIMTIMCDKSSLELIDALSERVDAGVDVRVILEGLWSRVVFRGCVKRMEDAGIEVIYANDLIRTGEQHSYFHNKIWIFDESEAIMGGENILNSENQSTGFNGKNRDTDIYIKGPAVTEIMGAYVDLYDRYVHTDHQLRKYRGIEDLRAVTAKKLAAETAAHLRGTENYDAVMASPTERDHGVCRFVIQGPQNNHHKVVDTFLEYVKVAQHSLHITTPQINFETGRVAKKRNTFFWNEVKARAIEGVNVDLVSNGVDGGTGELSSKAGELADRWMRNGHPGRSRLLRNIIYSQDIKTSKGNRKYLELLANVPNFRVWTFFQYYHSKTIDFDHIAVAVGSHNLDENSSEQNHESTLICQDEKLARDQDAILLQDMVNSTPVFAPAPDDRDDSDVDSGDEIAATTDVDMAADLNTTDENVESSDAAVTATQSESNDDSDL
jgi:phosphatidylserine/phosphatidylglycerophosphate/cardiolipin synthase-like enzyme